MNGGNRRPTLAIGIARLYLVWMSANFGFTHGIHQQLSSKELHHIFGVKRKEDVPLYSFVNPELHSLSSAPNGYHQYILNHDKQHYEFELLPLEDLFSPDGFHMIARGVGNESRMLMHPPSAANCLYQGHAVSHNATNVALSGCGLRKRALISLPNGDFLIVNPVPPHSMKKLKHGQMMSLDDKSLDNTHVIFKRSSQQHFKVVTGAILAESDEKECLYDQHDDPFPEDHKFGRLMDRMAVVRGPVVVELGVFVDDAMWNHFADLYQGRADVELMEFILAAVNNIHLLFTHKSLNPAVNIVITRYEVLKTPPPELRKDVHSRGNVDLLLEHFCDYQHGINPKSDDNPRHWDHAILFSGYDLYRGSLKSVAGYAPVKGMCSGSRSCTINEGLDFGAVFVITHEMGHSLGMVHDGDNGCNRNIFIMSPSVGAGKTSWSTCSNSEYTDFINKLGTLHYPDNCLLDDPRGGSRTRLLDHGQSGTLPGERYSLDQQCRIFHGECWEHELKEPNKKEEVCNMVWCGAGEGLIRTAHPALQGTMCGDDKWCDDGECVPWRSDQRPIPMDGAWTEWSDSMPRKSYGHESDCGGYTCSMCKVDDQLRLRRSLRLCENPAPNYGGKGCQGSKFRGIVCDQTPCRTDTTVNEYASQKCSDLKNDPGVPNFLLTGKGFQYDEAPCRVWCHMKTQNYIRAIGNFPDGTPCGKARYCVKGNCQVLSCDGKAVVEKPEDCIASRDDRITILNSRPAAEWTEWNEWSTCSRSCGGGIFLRTRNCLNGNDCPGPRRQGRACNIRRCTPLISRVASSDDGVWGIWESWSGCGTSCGSGYRTRKRSCYKTPCTGPNEQASSCYSGSCPSALSSSFGDSTNRDDVSSNGWTAWSEWSTCSVSCDGGLRIKRRDCDLALCLGRNTETQSCGTVDCPARSEDSGSFGSWSSWTSWDECSRSCGRGGVRSRRRLCIPLGSQCSGPGRQTQTCYQPSCIPTFLHRRRQTSQARDSVVDDEGTWTDWAGWTLCSRTCGDKSVKFRKRQCLGDSPCSGRSIAFTNCQLPDCGFSRRGSPESDESFFSFDERDVDDDVDDDEDAYVFRGVTNDDAGSIELDEEEDSSSGWSMWSFWSSCSTTCGRGTMIRRRACRRGTCSGPLTDRRRCFKPRCRRSKQRRRRS